MKYLISFQYNLKDGDHYFKSKHSDMGTEQKENPSEREPFRKRTHLKGNSY